MFTTSLRGGKAFATEQKIRELKSRISKPKAISDKKKAKIPAVTTVKQSAENMNNVKSQKYGRSSNVIKEKSLYNEKFRALFNFKRIERSKNVSNRLDKYDRKKYAAKKKKLRENLSVGEKVLVLVERTKKNVKLENFINKLFKIYRILIKKTVFVVRKKQKIDKKTYYWLKNEEKNKYLLKTFQRSELFATVDNFVL